MSLMVYFLKESLLILLAHKNFHKAEGLLLLSFSGVEHSVEHREIDWYITEI